MGRAGAGVGAVQMMADGGEQRPEVERFLEERGGDAGGPARTMHGQGGDDDDGQVRKPVPQMQDQILASEGSHAQVRHDQIGSVPEYKLEGILAVPCRHDPQRLRHQDAADAGAHSAVIINEQNGGCGLFRRCGALAGVKVPARNQRERLHALGVCVGRATPTELPKAVERRRLVSPAGGLRGALRLLICHWLVSN